MSLKTLLSAFFIYIAFAIPSIILLRIEWALMVKLKIDQRVAFCFFMGSTVLLLVPGVLHTGIFSVFAPLVVALCVSWQVGWHNFLIFQKTYYLVILFGGLGVVAFGLIFWRIFGDAFSRPKVDF